MIRVYPQYEEDLLVRLFHKGVKAQQSAADVDWNDPIQFSQAQSHALASVALPQMASAGETTAQLSNAP